MSTAGSPAVLFESRLCAQNGGPATLPGSGNSDLPVPILGNERGHDPFQHGALAIVEGLNVGTMASLSSLSFGTPTLSLGPVVGFALEITRGDQNPPILSEVPDLVGRAIATEQSVHH